jgi:hypothetical protein
MHHIFLQIISKTKKQKSLKLRGYYPELTINPLHEPISFWVPACVYYYYYSFEKLSGKNQYQYSVFLLARRLLVMILKRGKKKKKF